MNTISSNPSLEVMIKSANKAETMLKLLANGRRLLILCHLLKRECSVNELAESINLSQSAISQHLAKMRNEGLVKTKKEGTTIYYRIGRPEVEAILATLYLIYCKE
ncbi:ArsR/SmtB family transcription factor [Legionella gresilensis]|uniref:ArsR/SmtB family transcription factor n=1 Tax=Legionella gresilensis TaxID=91823 RepID=UPI001040F915|nr:metalloregulator ArsR/SmtB family transcription factor [Legionella gresilensis]